ncbi:hypothetical protein GCM10011576_23600 [Micromonospora parathelypteridis]|nr:hypothetical protein GCM10011576_23600 [Micromonospora parathelypteridis]
MNSGTREWPVEQEGGQREEDRDAHIQPGQHISEAAVRVGQPAEKGHMVDEHPEYRHGPKAFQSG